jgi:hypothetical protein
LSLPDGSYDTSTGMPRKPDAPDAPQHLCINCGMELEAGQVAHDPRGWQTFLYECTACGECTEYVVKETAADQP